MKSLSCNGTAPRKFEALDRHPENRPPVHSTQLKCENDCELPCDKKERNFAKAQGKPIAKQVVTLNQVDTSSVKRSKENEVDSMLTVLKISDEEMSAPALRVEGTICGYPARILIDCGAEANFVAKRFAAQKMLRMQRLDNGKFARLPEGTRLPIDEVIPNVALKMGSHKDRMNILCVDMDTKADVILGMPWLLKHNPDINWRERLITFRPSGKGMYSINGVPEWNLPRDTRPECLLSAVQFGNAVQDPTNVVFLGHVVSEGEGVGKESQENKEIQELIKEYKDVFPSELPSGKPPDRGIAHKIDLQANSTPVFGPVYRLSQAEADELKKQLEELEQKGYIQPSKSPYGAPVLLVKKQDGSLRLCVDYRGLNRLTVKNRYALPFISDLTDRLHGAKFFTKIDLRSGYWQVRVADEDVHKTAFRTRYGHYEFTVMPFGLTNAPATFMRLMNEVLRPLLDKCVVVYLDDILIYSKTLEEHVEHIKLVLDALRKHQLYAKLSKCSFAENSVHYLGYRIDQEGLHAEEDKLAAIKDWPEPQDKHQLMQFLGLANYYRKFVGTFSDMAAPMTELLKKDKPYEWTTECRQAFNSVKKALISAPVLCIPDPNGDFEMSTDASNVGIGAELTQNGKTVMFFSRKLKDAEVNYATHDKEALAIVEACKEWRIYLVGKDVKVHTDHNSLKYLLTQPNLNSRQK